MLLGLLLVGNDLDIVPSLRTSKRLAYFSGIVKITFDLSNKVEDHGFRQLVKLINLIVNVQIFKSVNCILKYFLDGEK